jgi:glutamate---cysteine ligase / carboxylate-amine ligase
MVSESKPPVSGGDPKIRGPITFGAEEEFLLIDPDTHLTVPRAVEVLAAVPSEYHSYIKYELLATQLEISTPVCHSLPQLREELTRLRAVLSRAAISAGCQLLPAGTGIMDTPRPAITTENERFAEQLFNLGSLADLPGLCACHVHVGVGSRDLAAAVSNHLRPWLPVLHSINTNSPFAEARDTGYSSWRSVLAARYPTSGPPPWHESAAHHDQIVRSLISAGAMADVRGVYWFARPSPVYPTIEVRVGDVCATVDETVFMAGLIRALVLTAVGHVADGVPAPRVDDRVLTAAHWRAARFGLLAEATDAVTAGLRPAWEMVDELISFVAPVLSELGDAEAIHRLRLEIEMEGAGSARQRAVYAEHGDLREVVGYLVGQTNAPSLTRASVGRS